MDEYISPSSPDLNVDCGVLTNEEGDIVLVHEHKITEEVDWVEYDKKEDQFIIVYKNSIPKLFPYEITPFIQSNILKGEKVIIGFLENEKVFSTHEVPLILREF